MADDQDETIERIAAALRPLPAVDPEARARVLVAVAAERERGDRASRARPRRAMRWAGGVALAAGAVGAAFLLGRSGTPAAAPSAAAGVPSHPDSAHPSAPVQLAARPAAAAGAPQPVQLVFHAPQAHRVSVVGDFTGWQAGTTIMQRDPVSGLWSVSLSLAPGRHVYAFLVDDTLWQRDPRAAAAPDADFGRPGSVLLVGRP